MLWVDDQFVTTDDLTALDSEVPSTAAVSNLTLTGDQGILQRGKEDAQAILARFMSLSDLSPKDLLLRDVNIPSWTLGLPHNYAGFAQLCVTGDSASNWSSLKRWVAAKTLLRFYRAAANKNADRYEDRWVSLHEAIQSDYWPNFKRRGLPLVFNPLPAPGAIMERAGTFDAGNLSSTPNAAGTVAGDYDFAVTWVGNRYVSGTNKQNDESYVSPRVTLSLVGGYVATVSIMDLTPPNGSQPAYNRSNARYNPGTAVGWNIWAGSKGGALYRQNNVPVVLGTTSYTLAGNPTLTGEQADLGQYDDIVLPINVSLQRG